MGKITVFKGLLIGAFGLLVFGCSSTEIHPRADISGFREQAKGETKAGIYVRAEFDAQSKATHYLWGVTHVNRPERTFREVFRLYLRDNTGWDVRGLNGDFVKWPEGSENEFYELASEEGLDYFFTASVDSWRQNYVLFFQWARIKFTLECYSVEDETKLCKVRSSASKLYGTDRQVLFREFGKIFLELGLE